jgi:hypothetical protein
MKSEIGHAEGPVIRLHRGGDFMLESARSKGCLYHRARRKFVSGKEAVIGSTAGGLSVMAEDS